MNEMNEREQDAAVIANYRAWCSEFDAIEAAAWSFALDQRLEELRELLSDGSATFADSALRTIDRLTAERDAARANEARWRERINAIIAIAESYECLAQNPDVETSVSQERLGFAQDIYQALGIESEASE